MEKVKVEVRFNYGDIVIINSCDFFNPSDEPLIGFVTKPGHMDTEVEFVVKNDTHRYWFWNTELTVANTNEMKLAFAKSFNTLDITKIDKIALYTKTDVRFLNAYDMNGVAVNMSLPLWYFRNTIQIGVGMFDGENSECPPMTVEFATEGNVSGTFFGKEFDYEKGIKLTDIDVTEFTDISIFNDYTITTFIKSGDLIFKEMNSFKVRVMTPVGDEIEIRTCDIDFKYLFGLLYIPIIEAIVDTEYTDSKQ